MHSPIVLNDSHSPLLVTSLYFIAQHNCCFSFFANSSNCFTHFHEYILLPLNLIPFVKIQDNRETMGNRLNLVLWYAKLLGIHALVRPPPKRIFDILDPIVMKWLFQLRVGLSPLQSHKKNNNFSDTPCDKCHLCKRTESLEHVFLNCICFTETRRALLNSVLTLNVNFNQLNPQNKIQLLLYGDTSFSDAINKLLLISTLKFLRD